MPFFGVSSRRANARTAAGLISCLILIGTLIAALKFNTSHPSAQATTPEFQTGKNVDIVGPNGTVPYHPAGSNPFLLGDPDKKQQNEPSCDISPNNPLIVFCGMNSYSAVDRPDIAGEPWVGASFTMDGGLTWKSHLHPGFKPKDSAAPAPFAPALGYETAADPVVRLAPGIGLYTFIAFNRDGAGALLMGRWYERTIESGFPYAWKDTVEIAKGTGSPTTAGRFVDKPAMTLSLLPGTGTYDFSVPDPTPTEPAHTRIQKVPAGVVHVAYAVFVGNDEQDGTKITYTRSANYGDMWEPAATLSESQSINQAPDIATDDATNRVVIVWRRFASATLKQSDAIMAAVSVDGGRSFRKPAVVANICSFTQGTTSASFRTTTHPFVTFDGTAFHVIWAERQKPCGTTPTGYSRIVMSNLSFGSTGTPTWSNPAPVDTASPASRRGHEFLPAIASAGNRILVSWIDTRNDVRVGATFPDPSPDPYVQDYVFAGKTKVRRRSADIFAAEAFAGQTPTFGAPKQVSRYLFGVFPGNPTPRQLERNKLNPRMFQSGKVPFLGDYTTAAAVRFVPKDPIGSPNQWVSSAGAPNVQPIFQLAWTDNRLVRGDVSAGLAEGTGTTYTPPPLSVYSETDPGTPRGVCSPATAGTRDQSVFSARITPPVVLLAASASKPTLFSDAGGTHQIRRSYAFLVRNTLQSTGDDKTISLDIGSTQPGVIASFRKITPEFPTALTTLPGVPLPHRSSIARTVYVESPESLARPVVQINVREHGALVATVYLNPNGNAAPLDDPLDPNQRITDGDQVDSIELHTPDIAYRATSIGTPAIDDPAIDDPAIDDPAIDDPAIDDPAIDDPAIDDPAIDDPAIDDPAIDDPAIDDPAIDDPAIDDPAIDDASVSASSIFDPDTSTGTNNSGQKLTQITWKIALKGNTTTSMTSKVFLNVSDAKLAALKSAIGPGKSQLLVSRRYRTSDRRGADCAPVRVSSYQVISNIVNPELTNSAASPDLVNPAASEPSFAIAPGDAVYLTFRVWGDVPELNPGRVGVVVQSQPGPPASEPVDTDSSPDLTAPALTLPGLPTPGVTAEATSPAGAVVTYVVTAIDDADGSLSVVCDKPSGTAFPIGTTPVTCSATDSSGNQATGAFDVVVADTTAPVMTAPADIVTEASSATGAVVTFSVSATDLATGAVTPTCTPASGTTFPIGTTTVTCSATDSSGNVATGTFNVVVADTMAPTLTLSATIVTEAASAAGAAVTFSASATDSIGGAVTPTCSPASGTTFPIGTTTVTCNATDSSGNVATRTFDVVVADTTPPTVTVPTNIVSEAASAAGAIVTFSASATDLTAGAVTPTCSPASGTIFPIGTTTVTCSATDSSGNEATRTFDVVVADTTAPTVTVPANIVTEAASAAGATVTFSASATDLIAGAVTPTCSPASGTTFPLGVTTVSCTASDGSHTGYASFTVTVRDTIAPVIVGTPGNITVFGGASGAVVTYTSPTAIDAISGPRPVSCSPASGSTFIGTKIVTCSASDTATPVPNTAGTTFTVAVTPDTIGPTITSAVSPLVLWPPDGTLVTVTVSGIANDAASGVVSISWSVTDEYRQYQPTGSIAAVNGTYTFQMVLMRDRKGSDKDGRHYTIRVSATDAVGNVTTAAPLVVNVHDQSGG